MDHFERRTPGSFAAEATTLFRIKFHHPAITTFIVDYTIWIVDIGRMARKPLPRPTPTEVEILGILWEHGPATVREVHERLREGRSVGYTGVLKILQNMYAKKLVSRDQSAHAHIYEAHEPARTKQQLLRDLIRRAFSGSASQLVLHLLDDQVTSMEEIEEIRRMLAIHRKKSK